MKTKEARGQNAAKRGARGSKRLEAKGLNEAMKQREKAKLLTRGSLACCRDAALPRAQRSSGALRQGRGSIARVTYFVKNYLALKSCFDDGDCGKEWQIFAFLKLTNGC